MIRGGQGRSELLWAGHAAARQLSVGPGQVLEFAIEKEAEAREFYLEWAGKLEDEHLREAVPGSGRRRSRSTRRSWSASRAAVPSRAARARSPTSRSSTTWSTSPRTRTWTTRMP
ncbi:MAG: hypothetical protein MZW92_16975 [Comamonadaceae bacterium]|nr:hypothetical protein [Comamonadaceae bacterium]